MKVREIHCQQGFVKTISMNSISLEYIQLTSEKAMKLTYYIQLMLQTPYLQSYQNVPQYCKQLSFQKRRSKLRSAFTEKKHIIEKTINYSNSVRFK